MSDAEGRVGERGIKSGVVLTSFVARKSTFLWFVACNARKAEIENGYGIAMTGPTFLLSSFLYTPKSGSRERERERDCLL